MTAPRPSPIDEAQLLMAIIPADGSSIGNMTIRAHLGWSAEHYAAVRQPLLDAGLLETGRGRGGSVRRTEASIVKRTR